MLLFPIYQTLSIFDYNKLTMPKQVIVIMAQNYPFGQCQERTTETTRVLVRKIYQVGVQQRNKLLQKVNILRKIKNQYMIKIESVLEEEQSVHFLFEYIPIKLETWISNINDQFIQNFRDQLIKFSSFLANNFIKIDFQLKNIGMDQNYGAKYFLDLDFTVDNSLNREKLKSAYIREITNLFKPYILNTNTTLDNQKQRKSSETPKEIHSSLGDRKSNDYSISPPTNKQLNTTINKNKEKALAQYYQEVNMSVDSENEKILQEFMDVLDNQDEQIKAQTNNRPQAIPKPPVLTGVPQVHYQRQPSMQEVPPKSNSINNQNIQNRSPTKLSSAQQIKTNQLPFQFNSETNFKSQSIKLKEANISQSTGRGKNQLKQPYLGNELSKEAAQLQDRVRCAIEKSLNVIQKFKAIKDSSLM